jgi:hypothetical protein
MPKRRGGYNFMTKSEFKTLWESSDDGGGLTFEDIAKCAQEWGLCSRPKMSPMFAILSMVLKSANIQEKGAAK